MVEHWFVVPGTRVRFPLIAPVEISWIFENLFTSALVAQWIEYLASNQGVAGSIPAERTQKTNLPDRLVFTFAKVLFLFLFVSLGNKRENCQCPTIGSGKSPYRYQTPLKQVFSC